MDPNEFVSVSRSGELCHSVRRKDISHVEYRQENDQWCVIIHYRIYSKIWTVGWHTAFDTHQNAINAVHKWLNESPTSRLQAERDFAVKLLTETMAKREADLIE